MKFIATRDVRNNPSEFRKAVKRGDVVLTVGGKPFAIAIGIDGDELEETIVILRRVRALQAMARMQKRAEERGLGAMSQKDIEQEVLKARKNRRRSS
jgi:antitoxin (DNA-binding transcriptional repressor) of toxin-antitoxin stability system